MLSITSRNFTVNNYTVHLVVKLLGYEHVVLTNIYAKVCLSPRVIKSGLALVICHLCSWEISAGAMERSSSYIRDKQHLFDKYWAYTIQEFPTFPHVFRLCLYYGAISTNYTNQTFYIRVPWENQRPFLIFSCSCLSIHAFSSFARAQFTTDVYKTRNTSVSCLIQKQEIYSGILKCTICWMG